VAQELEQSGFPPVYILEGGWRAWEKENFPTVPKEEA